MAYTIYILPSQIETFTLESPNLGTITNEYSTASKPSTWRVEVENAENETVTVSAPGFKTTTVTLREGRTSDNVCLSPKTLYAWTCDDGSGATIYTATKNPTQGTLFHTDYFNANGEQIDDSTPIDTNSFTAYIGAYDSTVESASDTEIVIKSYIEPK